MCYNFYVDITFVEKFYRWKVQYNDTCKVFIYGCHMQY